MKPTIFNEKVAKALRTWHQTARKEIKNRRSGSITPISSRSSTPTHGSSPVHLLRYYKNEVDSLPVSPRSPNYNIAKWQAEQESVDQETEAGEHRNHLRSQATNFDHETRVTDFSFDNMSSAV